MEQFIQLLHLNITPGIAIVLASILAPLVVFCRSIPVAIFNKIRDSFIVTITIDESSNMSGTTLFKSFNSWIVKHRVPWFTRIYEVNYNSEVVAGSGTNIIIYDNTLYWSSMFRNETKGDNNDKIGTYTLRTFKWNKNKAIELTKEICKPSSMAFKGSMLKINSGNVISCLDFPDYLSKKKQIVNKDIYSSLDKIFKDFSDVQSYRSKGIPHKETILLYGPPGTAKTSISRHLSAKYNYDLITVDPSSINTETFTLRSWAAKNFKGLTVYLVEDINSNPEYLSDNNPTNNSSFMSDPSEGTLSTLLNSLDGAIPLEGCIVILTSNHINKLNKSIYRIGRVDHHIHMDYIDNVTALNYLEWDKEDPRCDLINNSDRLHVATIRDLKFTSTYEEASVVISGGEICLNLDKHVEK